MNIIKIVAYTSDMICIATIGSVFLWVFLSVNKIRQAWRKRG